MRSFVLFCIFLSGAASQAAPFSHKLHLSLGVECAACHAAALKSTRAQDNLIPGREVCAGCHDDGRIPSRTLPKMPPSGVAVVKFSHSLHLRMGSHIAPIIASAIDHRTYLQPPGDTRRHLNTKNPCGACHRGMEESETVTPAVMPRMADCLVCHTQIEPPFSCEACHAKDAPIRPPTHTAHFVSDHSSGRIRLDKTTCAACHGRSFQCAGCH